MIIRPTALALLAALAICALPSSAQNMKPGLWEINNKMQTGNGQFEKAMAQMQAQMASMPPEQRKMMEDMMARQGVDLSGLGSNGGMVVKMCMTKEMVAQNQVPIQQQGDCTHRLSPVVGNSMKVSFSCTNPPASGEGQITFKGDTAYAMKMNMRSTAAGKPETMSLDATGKWLGADCGNIKPMVIPKAK